MKVVLLGLEFFINNLGCEALSYSFSSELYSIAKEQKRPLELVTVVFADKKKPYIPETGQEIKCIGIHYKSIDFWKKITKEFQSSDLIVDFTMGDSFSDIYGKKRFILDAMIKSLAIRSKTPFILGPQTYGPYKDIFIRKWATRIMKKAAQVYARDERSKEVAKKLSGREVILTTDVAFALPYEKVVLKEEDKIKVGFNPSGLLWGGGYTHNNQFGLQIDYQQYCLQVCDALNEDEKYSVYLIPHVGTVGETDCGDENDLSICRLLQRKYPKMKVVDTFQTPMDVKGHIAAMDIFIGARMHATVAAFSSGVATIPVSYSRKFEGLYGSLQYDYVIHAVQVSTKDAIAKTMEYIDQYKQLQRNVESSMDLVRKKQILFRNSIAEVMQASETK